MSDDLIYESYRQVIYQVMQQLAGEANNGQVGYFGGYDPRRGKHEVFFGCRRSNRERGGGGVGLQRPDYINAPTSSSSPPPVTNTPVPVSTRPRPPIIASIPNVRIPVVPNSKQTMIWEGLARGTGTPGKSVVPGEKEKFDLLPKPDLEVPDFPDPGEPNPTPTLPDARRPGGETETKVIRPRYPTIISPNQPRDIFYMPQVTWEFQALLTRRQNYYSAEVYFFWGEYINRKTHYFPPEKPYEFKKLGRGLYYRDIEIPDKTMLDAQFYGEMLEFHDYSEVYPDDPDYQKPFALLGFKFSGILPNLSYISSITFPELPTRSDIEDVREYVHHYVFLSEYTFLSRAHWGAYRFKPSFSLQSGKKPSYKVRLYRNPTDAENDRAFRTIERATGFYAFDVKIPDNLIKSLGGSNLIDSSRPAITYPESTNLLDDVLELEPKKAAKILAEKTFWGRQFTIAFQEYFDGKEEVTSFARSLGLGVSTFRGEDKAIKKAVSLAFCYTNRDLLKSLLENRGWPPPGSYVSSEAGAIARVKAQYGLDIEIPGKLPTDEFPDYFLKGKPLERYHYANFFPGYEIPEILKGIVIPSDKYIDVIKAKKEGKLPDLVEKWLRLAFELPGVGRITPRDGVKEIRVGKSVNKIIFEKKVDDKIVFGGGLNETIIDFPEVFYIKAT